MDIETSGLDRVKCGIWQIGAYDTISGEEFLEESRVDDEEDIFEGALRVTGKTEEQLRDLNKQTQKKLLERFFKWVSKRKFKNFLCQNPQFDVAFLEIKAKKFELEIPFHFRSFDLHSIAQLRYKDLRGKFLIQEDHSSMGLSNILDFCGMEDSRGVHNALEDSKLTAECFYRLVYGKVLFPEFLKFEIPEYLKK